ncbi:hypothetical protein EIP86_002734 [Pleurotus ostreatoroseus]|nr:hypothetical protein EIP86_002734 [Pleurotus ostreatoroseus]
MTEYDYSPEAYERYMENQNRVSHWVSDQASRKHQYASPFNPPPLSIPPSHFQPPPAPRPGPRSASASASYRSPTSSRRSSPARAAQPEPYPYPARQPHAHPTVTSPLREHPPSSAPRTATTATAYAPAGPGASYRTYDGSAREVIIPAPKRGETYVIIPPKYGRVEIVTDNHTSVQSAYGSYRTSPTSTLVSSSTTTKSPPLLKRIFTSMGPPSRDARYYGSGGHVRTTSRRSY